jgi:uncharacterized protein YxjI
MLESNTFAVREHKSILSTAQRYDVLNSETGELLGIAEERIGVLTQALRFFLGKSMLPTTVELREKPDDSLVFSLHRSAYLFQSRVEVRDAMGLLVGYFKSKVLPICGGLQLYDKDGNHFAEVKGRHLGHNYQFLTADGTRELGAVSKTFDGVAGLVAEILFSADIYFVTVSPELGDQPIAKMLILAATLVIDLVYKSSTSPRVFG